MFTGEGVCSFIKLHRINENDQPYGWAFLIIGGRREFAILASQCACMHIGVHRLTAVLLEFLVHPASVPEAVSIPESQSQ